MHIIKFKDFNRVCRCCLVDHEDLTPISTINIKDMEEFTQIINIKVKEDVDDKLPNNVCIKCVQQLENISSFIKMCKTNEETLKNAVVDELRLEKLSEESQFYLKEVKEEMDEFESEIVLELNKDSIITCENCSESFASLADLSEHYKDFVKCKPKVSSSSSCQNIVDYLKKPKKRKREIKNESEEVEAEYVKGKKLKGKRRFLCNYCGKNYTRKNGLDRHMLSHTGIKPFECKECGKCYITKDTLKTHMLTHTGIKAHKCTVCDKSFTQSSHLSYHMRRHAGEKPHSCTFCGKGFLSTYHLDRHKLMHTGVKPYECKQCGKQFVRSTTLRDHMLIHTGEKPFQCQHCGKQFNRKQSLTNHVLVHTGEKYKNAEKNVLVNNYPVYPGGSFVEIKRDDSTTFLDKIVE